MKRKRYSVWADRLCPAAGGGRDNGGRDLPQAGSGRTDVQRLQAAPRSGPAGWSRCARRSPSASTQQGMDLRHAAMVTMAQRAHQGHDVQLELVLGQRQGALGLRPTGHMVPATDLAIAPANLKAQPHWPGQYHQSAAVLVEDPHHPAARHAQPTVGVLASRSVQQGRS
jgi:hypothetical protein